MTNQRSIKRTAAEAGAEQTARSVVWRVLGNSAWLVAAEGGARVVSLATLLYLSRTLDPRGVGAVQFGLAVFSLLQLVCTGGTETLLVPEAARRPQDLARLAGRSLLISWVQFTVAFTCVAAGFWARGMSPEMQSSAVLFGLAAGMVPLSLRFAFVAREQARVVGLGTLACQLTFLALCLTAVRTPDDVGRVAVFWMIATAVRVTSQLAIFVREHGALVVDWSGLAGWLRRATLLGTGSIARGLMLNVDVLVLGLFRPADEVARYALAAKLPLFVASLSTLLYVALFPTLARAATSADGGRVARIEASTLEAVLGIAVPGAVCLWLVADPLMVLLFTERYRDAAPLLAVLVWRIPLVAATGIFRTAAWARRPETDARVAVQMLGATVVVLVVLAARAGAPGVAWGILAGDAIALALYVHAGGRPAVARVPPAALLRLALGVAVALALMAAVPRDARLATVAGTLAAWAVAALVADAPHARRLARDLGRPGSARRAWPRYWC